MFAALLTAVGVQAAERFPTDVDVLVAGGTEAAVEDEPVPVQAKFTCTEDGAKARASVGFPEPVEVTRLELRTTESGWGKNPSLTRECHFIYSADGQTYSKVVPMQVVMNYSPGGLFVWRAELNRKVKAIAVGATRDPKAKRLVIGELAVFRRSAPGTRRLPTPLGAWQSSDVSWFEDRAKWRDLAGFVMIETSRWEGGKWADPDVRCYLTSLAADARRLRRIARAHWGVENRLHWVLDVVFGEDYCRAGEIIFC